MGPANIADYQLTQQINTDTGQSQFLASWNNRIQLRSGWHDDATDALLALVGQITPTVGSAHDNAVRG